MNTATRKLRPLFALATGMALVATTASADPSFSNERISGTYSHPSATGNVVDVQVRVDGGSVPLYFKPGTNDRHYFQAYKGRNYSLVVHNTTGKRVGVLIAVDGLNVVNGQRSKLDRNEQMYVLDPWESADIQGWRTSLDDVRRFVFVDEERSYSARTGQANGDMGWIRVVAYREVERQPRWGWIAPQRKVRDDAREQGSIDELGAQSQNEAAPAPAAGELKAQKSRQESRSMADQSSGQTAPSAPGTGWGDRRYDPVQQTSFQAQAWAADQISLRYEYASGLRALGIFPRSSRVFDRDQGELGFAKPPRW